MFKRIYFILIFYSLMSSLRSQNNVVNSLPCFDRTFSLSLHIVQDDEYMDNITVTALQSWVNDLNEAFDPLCINFEICKTEVLNNHNFAYYEDSIMTDEIAVLYNDIPYINLYVVETFIDPWKGEGFATQGGISIGDDAIVVVNKYSGSNALIHEMGHFFGLYNTFEIFNFGVEFADGSNCATAGDLICDTPADPDGMVFSDCSSPPQQDVNGDYYIPPMVNHMSNYGSCRCEFTHQQYWRMANTYLLNPKAHW